MRRCTELRRKPLAEFTVEDLRIMLGQEVGVLALLPLAVQVLLREPLAEGDYYPAPQRAPAARLGLAEPTSRTQTTGVGAGRTPCGSPVF
ncbi:contact-dependent growth inhibition system immunity protein [Micromonospora chersina]|uniref:contact-dependent growth inhibition system immunity protein n=1 Tax=Micromonospora chersina TaxID=47854 RepID=UPI0033F708E3